jgi:hypothetical protein
MNKVHESATTPEDFIEWAMKHKDQFSEFYLEHILPVLIDVEDCDYIGTEVFDGRFQ